MIPFAPETFAFPASTSDFVINLVSLGGGLLAVIAAIALFKARDLDARSNVARALLGVVGALVVLGTIGSVAARLTREDPLGQEQDVTVTAEDTEFSPVEISSPTNVSVFIENEDLTAHTFTIDELGIDEAIPGGGSARAVVEDAEPGTYEFRCEVTGHDDMKGTLTVGQPGA
jgi:plastocyanin